MQAKADRYYLDILIQLNLHSIHVLSRYLVLQQLFFGFRQFLLFLLSFFLQNYIFYIFFERTKPILIPIELHYLSVHLLKPSSQSENICHNKKICLIFGNNLASFFDFILKQVRHRWEYLIIFIHIVSFIAIFFTTTKAQISAFITSIILRFGLFRFLFVGDYMLKAFSKTFYWKKSE